MVRRQFEPWMAFRGTQDLSLHNLWDQTFGLVESNTDVAPPPPNLSSRLLLLQTLHFLFVWILLPCMSQARELVPALSLGDRLISLSVLCLSIHSCCSLEQQFYSLKQVLCVWDWTTHYCVLLLNWAHQFICWRTFGLCPPEGLLGLMWHVHECVNISEMFTILLDLYLETRLIIEF